MDETQGKNRGRLFTRLLMAAAVCLVLFGGGLALLMYLRSPQFNDLVREKVVASIEESNRRKG